MTDTKFIAAREATSSAAIGAAREVHHENLHRKQGIEHYHWQ